MRFDSREDIIQLTPLWKGERFENGRPKVPDDILRRFQRVTTEEAWGVLWENGYKYQFQGDWKVIHPGKILVGRAVTAVMVPKRPDLDTYLLEYGQKEEGRKGFFNSWVIESLQEGDVLVVDMFDKVYEGTFVGGNLSTAVSRRTKYGGQVIWGGIRDVQQVMEITNIQTFYRGNDPTPIRDVTLVGMNVPCRIGNAICMPGDVVLGTPAGIIFVPPHLAEECCIKAEKTAMRDRFGLQRLREGKYTTAQIDSLWTDEIWQDFHNWRKENTPPEYAHLDWSGEEEEMRKRQTGPTIA
uniref:RraA family protein n=1 Tax=Anaerolinea thermolimosa TaxID=229919 RepID=A0A7C4PLB3_9CHLR